jgi:hypothetical protein
MLFIFTQAPYRFWIALLVFGFEGRQFKERLLLCRLLPNGRQFGGNRFLFALGDGIHDIALFMHQTPLTWGRGKQGTHCGKQPIVPIGHDQIHLCGSTGPHILQDTHPSIFIFFGTSPHGENIFASLQIYS